MEARLDGELNAARSIQMGLLPRAFPGPPERHDVEIFASIEPARMVGGDLYDFVFLDSDHRFFRDCRRVGQGRSGRLVHGDDQGGVAHGDAALSDGARSAYSVEANAKISAASEELGAGGANMMFVTVFAGILDLASGDARLRQRRARFAVRAARGRSSLRLCRSREDRRSARSTTFSIRSSSVSSRRARRCSRIPTESPRLRIRTQALYSGARLERVACVGADDRARKRSSISCATMSAASRPAPSRPTTSRCSRCDGWGRFPPADQRTVISTRRLRGSAT